MLIEVQKASSSKGVLGGGAGTGRQAGGVQQGCRSDASGFRRPASSCCAWRRAARRVRGRVPRRVRMVSTDHVTDCLLQGFGASNNPTGALVVFSPMGRCRPSRWGVVDSHEDQLRTDVMVLRLRHFVQGCRSVWVLVGASSSLREGSLHALLPLVRRWAMSRCAAEVVRRSAARAVAPRRSSAPCALDRCRRDDQGVLTLGSPGRYAVAEVSRPTSAGSIRAPPRAPGDDARSRAAVANSVATRRSCAASRDLSATPRPRSGSRPSVHTVVAFLRPRAGASWPLRAWSSTWRFIAVRRRGGPARQTTLSRFCC